MRSSDVETFCLSLPGVTVHTPWGDSRVYKVGNKMFAMLALGERGRLPEVWFKAGEGSFEILVRQNGVRPCPYLARAKWVALDSPRILPPKVLKAYLGRAHAQVMERLSKKKRAAIQVASREKPRRASARPSASPEPARRSTAR
jgi:predicted DNA-binding protein (MmcQ/YjbR family)